MANPQLEDGYIRLARELCTALTKANLSGAEFRVLLAVVGKTYGWNKKQDQISISQLSALTGLSKRGVCKATISLVNKKALGREQKGTTNVTTYWINKDYEKWLLTSEQNVTSEQNGTVTSEQTGNLLVNKTAPTIDTIQKTIKDTAKKQLLLRQEQSFGVTWSLYPRKIGKDKAFKAYCKTVVSAELAKQCKRAVENYLEEISDNNTDEKFIKYGSSFFNQWNDYYNIKPFETDNEVLEMAFDTKD